MWTEKAKEHFCFKFYVIDENSYFPPALQWSRMFFFVKRNGISMFVLRRCTFDPQFEHKVAKLTMFFQFYFAPNSSHFREFNFVNFWVRKKTEVQHSWRVLWVNNQCCDLQTGKGPLRNALLSHDCSARSTNKNQ